jgi:hypothetical protein
MLFKIKCHAYFPWCSVDVLSEDSPGKRQRRSAKVVPSRKRCKALESISGKDLLHKEVNIDVTLFELAQGWHDQPPNFSTITYCTSNF